MFPTYLFRLCAVRHSHSHLHDIPPITMSLGRTPIQKDEQDPTGDVGEGRLRVLVDEGLIRGRHCG